MKHTLTATLLLINSLILYPQVILTIEAREIIDTETGVSSGYSIPRNYVTILTFRSNSLTSVNSAGYILQAGDEIPGQTNNKLDGEVITGNKFTWNGTDETSMTHALFTGYNIDVVIKYNYLLNTPNGIQRKSNGMTDNNGVIAYNILKNPKIGVAIKGINGIRVYNNTFFSDKTPAQTNRGLVDIHANKDNGLNVISTGTKVFNNIFYCRNRVFCIKILETACLEGFESDYNLFWCEAGDPVFEVNNETKTFAQWQALGYDQHSVVVNPGFVDFNDFVPGARLDFGKDLGQALLSGLATDATWNKTTIRTADQNGLWQVGARVFSATSGEEDEEEELPRNMTLIYPNPAYGNFYLLMTDQGRLYQTMKIYDSTGKLVLTKSVGYGRTEIQVPENFSAGLYTITLESDSLNRYIRKLIILD